MLYVFMFKIYVKCNKKGNRKALCIHENHILGDKIRYFVILCSLFSQFEKCLKGF